MRSIFTFILSFIILVFSFQEGKAQTTIDFNDVENFSGLGLAYTEGGFTFSITDPGEGRQITGRTGMGYQGTGSLYDNNLIVGAITRWTIRKTDNSTFQFRG